MLTSVRRRDASRGHVGAAADGGRDVAEGDALAQLREIATTGNAELPETLSCRKR